MTVAEHTAVPSPPVDEHGLQRRHQLDRRLLDRQRGAGPGAVLDRPDRGHDRQHLLAGVDRLDPVRLHPGVQLRRDRGPLPAQVRRRLGLWRHRLGQIFQAVRALLGVVQLDRLVAGAVHRLGLGRPATSSSPCSARPRRSTPGRSPWRSLDWLHAGLSLRINATFLLGRGPAADHAFAIQHRGISGTAKNPDHPRLPWPPLVPLVLIGAVPLITGGVHGAEPRAADALGHGHR